MIAFNGEIYNFQSLRAKIKPEQYTFRSKTDTEVILALYKIHGEACFEMLNGMFALAIWDTLEKTLVLARDRLGKKPLYFYQAQGDIAFASELKSLLTLEHVPRDIRLDAVYDFFAYQYVPDPKSIFENIFKLEPGAYLKIGPQGTKKAFYWQLSFSDVSDDEPAHRTEKLRALVEDCTTRRMLSDVPLGAFLSGGVDSSGIVAFMAKNSETPVTTCSIGFADKAYNEVEFARSVAEQYETHHHEFTVDNNFVDELSHIVSFFDEPFADPSLVPTFFVSKLARQKVTVALAGDGGDELFAGYEKYSADNRENTLRQLFPAFLRESLFPPLARFLKQTPIKLCQRAGSLLNSLALAPDRAFYQSNAHITDDEWNTLAKDSVKETLQDYHPATLTCERYHECDGQDHIAKILYTDIKTFLPGGILVKVDRMSMANSLEVRAPLLDYEVAEFAAKTSSDLKFKRGEKKHILKAMFLSLIHI